MSNTKIWPDPDSLNNAVYILDPATNKATAFSGTITTITNDGSFATATDFGAKADTSASSDTGTFSLIALIKRAVSKLTSIVTDLENSDNISLISASAVSGTQTSADQTNASCRGVKVWLNITTFGAALTLNIQYKDPVSLQYITALSSAAIGANTFTEYTIYPGITATPNVSLNDVLPKTWRVQVTGASTSTFTVSASLIK